MSFCCIIETSNIHHYLKKYVFISSGVFCCCFRVFGTFLVFCLNSASVCLIFSHGFMYMFNFPSMYGIPSRMLCSAGLVIRNSQSCFFFRKVFFFFQPWRVALALLDIVLPVCSYTLQWWKYISMSSWLLFFLEKFTVILRVVPFIWLGASLLKFSVFFLRYVSLVFNDHMIWEECSFFQGGSYLLSVLNVSHIWMFTLISFPRFGEISSVIFI